jgi:hypothetical protein
MVKKSLPNTFFLTVVRLRISWRMAVGNSSSCPRIGSIRMKLNARYFVSPNYVLSYIHTIGSWIDPLNGQWASNPIQSIGRSKPREVSDSKALLRPLCLRPTTQIRVRLGLFANTTVNTTDKLNKSYLINSNDYQHSNMNKVQYQQIIYKYSKLISSITAKSYYLDLLRS